MAKDKETTATEAAAVEPTASAAGTTTDTTVGEAQAQGNESAKAIKDIEVESIEVKDLDKKWQKRINVIFEADKKLEKLYVTSDEQIFADITFAKPHSKTLKDKSIGVILKS